jgi:hypothetical protein
MKTRSVKVVSLLVFIQLAIGLHAQTPTHVYTAACANSGALSGSPWPGTPPYDYRCRLPEPTTAGDTLILTFGYDNTGGNQVWAISDDGGNTWGAADVVSGTANNKQVRMYHVSNVNANTTYVNIRLPSGGLNGFWQPIISEFYNVGNVDNVTESCNSATLGTITSGNLTTFTKSGDLIYQVALSFAVASTSYAAGSQSNIAWGLAFELLGDGAAAQYGVYNSTASLNPTFTSGSSNLYISCAMAYVPAASGSAPSAKLRTIRIEHDAMPKNAANPWSIGMISTGDVVYFAYVGNDAITSLTSSPPPSNGWVASGADFNGLNGHNHVNFYCGKFSSPPGSIILSLTRSANTNDSINMIYDVVGGTCNLDGDSGGQAGNQSTLVGNLTTCSSCLTPTKQNDFILVEGGQAFCTATSLTTPSGAIDDAGYFSGNTIDGPTQTDENNFWGHYYNGSSLSPLTFTWGETCGGTAEQNWASRVVAYKSIASGISHRRVVLF